ncbi:copper amine oxidase N-terminal domain-containing protein [Clostridium sp. 'deep sea']|uniref:copper amine oxidase N-terminal domain-containing protein n=1 Tax=Clostridium sp. 'deep sea' TaxID=2779445 RepID=UPI0018966075|nr:copper amine oxidase N-terminal domain-containing protein [Clostridium sp. 'deep sea']QOR34245.1 copper amine oxidase N-terminal domain-containing protein [Clostridium sp. 'deep sea']
MRYEEVMIIKRLLSIFSIVALIVSMFSGVTYAEKEQNDVYKIVAEKTTINEGSLETLKIDIKVSKSGATPIATTQELDGLSLAFFAKDSDVLVKNDGVDITQEIVGGACQFLATDIETLPRGTYYIKIVSEPGSVNGTITGSQNQYFNLIGSADYDEGDPIVEVATINITYGADQAKTALADASGNQTEVDNNIQESDFISANFLRYQSNLLEQYKAELASQVLTVDQLQNDLIDKVNAEQELLKLPNTHTTDLNTGENIKDWVKTLINNNPLITVNIEPPSLNAAIEDDGTVRRQSSESIGDVVFKLSCENYSNTKTIKITVPVKSDDEKLSDAENDLGSAFTETVAKEFGDNILTWATNQITGVTVAIKADGHNHSAIETNGVINRQGILAKENLVFILTASPGNTRELVFEAGVQPDGDLAKIEIAKTALGNSLTETVAKEFGTNILTWANNQTTDVSITIKSAGHSHSAIATNGVITRTGVIETDVLTFVIEAGTESQEHEFTAGVQPDDDLGKIEKAKTALGDTFAESNYEFGDNILEWAQNRVSDVTITILSVSHVAIGANGDISRKSIATDGEVVFTITASEEDKKNITFNAAVQASAEQTELDNAEIALEDQNNTIETSSKEFGDNIISWANNIISNSSITVEIENENHSVINSDGSINRYATNNNETVTFKLTSGLLSATVDLSLEVLLKTSAERVNDAVTAITNGNANALVTNENILIWAQNLVDHMQVTVALNSVTHNAISSITGVVTQQVTNESGSVNFQVTSNALGVNESQALSKNVTITARNLTDDEKLQTVKNQMPTSYTVTSSGENLVAWLTNKVTATGITGVNVNNTVSSYNSSVNNTGIATFGTYQNTGNVVFTLKCGSNSKTLTVFITVPKNIPVCKIKLDTSDIIEHCSTFGYATISGKILDYNNNYMVSSADCTIKLYIDENKDGILDSGDTQLETQYASNGSFSFKTVTTRIAQIIVVGDSGPDAKFNNSLTDSYDIFRIVPRVELIDKDRLEWTYPQSGQATLQGRFPNEDSQIRTPPNETAQKLTLNFINSNDKMGALIQSAVFANSSSFGFLFDGAQLNNTQAIGLYYDGILLIRGSITHGELSFNVTNKIVNKLGEQELVFNFNLNDDYINKTGSTLYLASGYRISYEITDDDDSKTIQSIQSPSQTITLPSGTVINANEAFDKTNAQIKAVSGINFTHYPTGNYKVKVRVYHGSVILQESTREFRVVKPAKYNLMNWNLNETSKVGELQFEFNKESSLHPDTNQAIVVRTDMTSSGLQEHLEVTIKGCGVNERFKTKDYDPNYGVDKFKVQTTETGTLKVTVYVYSSPTDTIANKTFEKTIKVNGWNITVYPKQVQVDTLTDYRVTVTDQNGNPVNNARISLNGEKSPYIVDGTSHNIIGGVYKFSKKFTSVEEIKVEAIKGNDTQVSLVNGISIIGKNVYYVEPYTKTLLNGFEEYIYVSILDNKGDIVYPNFERIDVTRVDGKEVYTVNGAISQVGQRKDMDNNGENESVRLKIKPNADQHALIIRATTDNGKNMGEFKINVQPPQVVLGSVKKLTENFERELEFYIVDPRDNSVIDEDVYFVASDEHVAYEVKDDNGSDIGVNSDGESGYISSYDGTYKCKVYIDDVNFKKLQKDEQLPVVSLMINVGNTDIKMLNIPIGEASLTTDPEHVIMNQPTNITLTYLDAEGKPLKDYKITLAGEEIGETDSSGKAFYSASAYSSTSLAFTAFTDDTKVTNSTLVNGNSSSDTYEPDQITVKRKVKSSLDVEPPKVSYVLRGNTAIITITDNVRIYMAMVNNEEVKMLIPKATVTHVVPNLKNGVNVIPILASDTKYNYIEENLIINVESVAEPVQFTLNKSTKYGTPKLVNNVTMVPVRFVEQLGAKVYWNNDSRTVTYILDEKVISMTVGSNIANVNGNTVKLKAIPYLNELGRAMVPIRTIATDLGFEVIWEGNDKPITIK